ncbi:MAG: hypothetical protein FD156_2648 [Nitrospirae bacterium]|nr:MAG: hypothetical protein FD156_2648 [Nitrospirota bacterium]
MKAIAEKTSKILGLLIPEGDLDYKVRKILGEDIKRKLTEFQLIDNRFRKKYNMTLDEFEKKNILKKKGFSFEAESDYHEWDSAVDAIRTLRAKIKGLP